VVDSVDGKVWVFNPIAEHKAEKDYVSKAPDRARIKADLARATQKKAEQEAREEQYQREQQRAEEEQRKKNEEEAAVREAARLAWIAEQDRLTSSPT